MTSTPDKPSDKGPERIWLQAEPEAAYPDDYREGVTWCVDQINEDDTGYVSADLYDQQVFAFNEQREALSALKRELDSLKAWQKHYDRASPDAFAQMKQERDRYRETLVTLMSGRGGSGINASSALIIQHALSPRDQNAVADELFEVEASLFIPEARKAAKKRWGKR